MAAPQVGSETTASVMLVAKDELFPPCIAKKRCGRSLTTTLTLLFLINENKRKR